MDSIRIEIPSKLEQIFFKGGKFELGDYKYRCAYGGRGGGKSFTFATMAALAGALNKIRVLCAREYHASIKESFHAELKQAIYSSPFLSSRYDVGVDYLKGFNGTEFIFKGLRHNMSSIRSMAQIDLTIIEEAEDVPERSWVELLPTVFRQQHSEVWILWNPKSDGSPVDVRFRKNIPIGTAITQINYHDNPWFPPNLDQLRVEQAAWMSPEMYSHIWEGDYLTSSDAQVFSGKWLVKDFEAQRFWDGPYQGLDFGFSKDPTAAVRCWIFDNSLYIDHEAGGVGLELDQTARVLKERIPDFDQYVIRGDSARPDSISFLKRNGLPRIESPGGKTKIEDGVSHLKSYAKIYVHPRCTNLINEMKMYSYKVDRLSGDVLPDIVDQHNHYIDALRYALDPIIKQNRLNLARLTTM